MFILDSRLRGDLVLGGVQDQEDAAKVSKAVNRVAPQDPVEWAEFASNPGAFAEKKTQQEATRAADALAPEVAGAIKQVVTGKPLTPLEEEAAKEAGKALVGALTDAAQEAPSDANVGSGAGQAPSPEGGGKDFDQARREAFEKAGMTNPEDVKFTKVDPKTGTVVEFKGKDGAKVAYDGPHDSPGPHHDTQHVGWQTGGKRSSGGSDRDNIPYNGPRHPSRSSTKNEGDVKPH